MARESGRYLVISLATCAFGLVFFLIGFATSYWLIPNSSTNNKGFENLGLWEICLSDYRYWQDSTRNVYDGCRWISSSDFVSIREWIRPSWFQGLQAVMCISLILEVSAVVIQVVTLFNIFPHKYVFLGLLSSGIATIITGFLTSVCMIVFYVKSLNDLEWIVREEKHNQSWSYYLLIPAILLFVVGGIASILAAIRIRREDRDVPVAIPYHAR